MWTFEDLENEAEREEREATQAGAVTVDDEDDDERGACCPDPYVAAARLCGCRGR